MSSPHATRAALNRYLAATPAYFATPSSYLAARPLVLYLGAKALGLGLAWVVLRVAGKGGLGALRPKAFNYPHPC